MDCKNCHKEFTEASGACPHCGKNSMHGENPAKEVDYEQLVDFLSANIFPPYIAELDLPDKTKRAFTCFEILPVTQPSGFSPTIEKAKAPRFYTLPFGMRVKVLRYLTPIVWWAFFFGPLYYIVIGMWRKGITLWVGAVVLFHFLDTALPILFYDRSLSLSLSIGFCYFQSMMFTYDFYRYKVKREKFWW